MTENDYNTQNVEDIDHLVIIDPANITDLEMYYGHWQMYLFSKTREMYVPTGDYFIFYKGHYFRDLKSKPMSKDDVQKIQLVANIYNKSGHPICVFRKERNI